MYSDEEIVARVSEMVKRGRIAPELAPAFVKVLQDEAAGKCIVMRDPGPQRRRLPRSPEEAQGLPRPWW